MKPVAPRSRHGSPGFSGIRSVRVWPLPLALGRGSVGASSGSPMSSRPELGVAASCCCAAAEFSF